MRRWAVQFVLLAIAFLTWGCTVLDQAHIYTISGGEAPSDHITVDDDILVRVNGATVFEDHDGYWTGDVNAVYTGEPIVFAARSAARVEIQASDAACCQALLGPLYVHRDDGAYALVTQGVTAESKGNCGAGVHDPDCIDVFFDTSFRLRDLNFGL